MTEPPRNPSIHRFLRRNLFVSLSLFNGLLRATFCHIIFLKYISSCTTPCFIILVQTSLGDNPNFTTFHSKAFLIGPYLLLRFLIKQFYKHSIFKSYIPNHLPILEGGMFFLIPITLLMMFPLPTVASPTSSLDSFQTEGSQIPSFF